MIRLIQDNEKVNSELILTSGSDDFFVKDSQRNQGDLQNSLNLIGAYQQAGFQIPCANVINGKEYWIFEVEG